uniref:Uncharacterized protein n=1 Tax=Manihot esculenta TaxID=3983 RepID=A0A2C9UDB3_MANES
MWVPILLSKVLVCFLGHACTVLPLYKPCAIYFFHSTRLLLVMIILVELIEL